MLPSSPVLRPFRYARQALPWLLALAVATCTADQGGPSASGTGYFSFRPVYHLAGGASLSQFGIVADSVRIRLTRPVAQVVLDTTLFFPPDSTSLRLALPVELQQTPETLTAVITISAGGTVIFTDSIEAEVKDGPPGTSTLPTVTFDYVGPGSNIASLTILPPDTNVFFGDTLFFTASAIDSNDAGVASFYVGWKSSDTAVAKINANGRLIAPAARGSVRVIGMTPTGIADTTLVTFSPVPVIVTADSGNAQTALVGDSLAALFVARVKGADSLGIAGIPVKFAAVTAGGAVRDTFTLVTDATGRVRTRALLGTVSGAYSFTATAVGTGLAARTFSATANPGAPSAILLAGGNNQVDTAGKALGLPLSVNVRDAFGNRVGGATVIFTRLTGSGSVGTDTVLTAVDGDASTTYTLGGTAGIDSIRAALAGTSAFVDFSETTVAGAATHQIFLGVDSQTTIAGTAFTFPIQVEVQDGANNPVAGVMVRFSVVSGGVTLAADSAPTDVNGHAGTTASSTGPAGAAQVKISSAGPDLFTTLIVLPAAPTVVAIAGGDAQTDTIGRVLPLPLSVHVTDVFSNDIAGAKIYWARTFGTGAVSQDSTFTNAAGIAQVNYTLGNSVGTDSIKATIAGTSASVTLTAIAISATPTQLIEGLGNAQTAVAGTAYTDSLTVQVLDNNDNPVPGVQVHWATTLGSAVLSADSTPTDVAGNAGIAVTAGTAVGPVTIAATVTGIASPVNFSLDVTPAAPAVISIASGNGQSANALTVLPLPLVVHVVDGFGNPVPGVGVAFTVSAGAGTIDSATATTNVVGNASSGSWTLGATAGVDTVVATSPALPGDTVIFTASALPAGTSKVWTGAVDNSWLTAGNWNPVGVPTTSDNVFIPAGLTAPFLGSTSNTNDLTVAAGQTLNTGSFVITANGNVDIAGTIQGAGTLIANGTSKTLRGTILVTTLNTTGTLTLNGPTQINSAYTLGAGSLTVGGQTLRLNNGLTVNGSGVLVMTNAADSVDVFGNATFSSGTSSTGSLTNGVIVYHGNFTQTGGAFTNYSASPGHRTRFFAFTLQTINFANPSPANSHFGSVEFANGVGEILATNIAATGTVLVTGGNVNGSSQTVFLTGDLISPPANWFIGTTEWSAAPTQYPDSIPGSVNVVAPWTLSHALEVGGNLTINSGGTLTVGGQALRVVGTFNVPNGQLVMNNAADSVDVGGNATFSSGTSGTGLLSAGVLVLRGNFTQTVGATTNFAPSGTHTVRFLGAGGQTVTFGSPSSAQSRFQNVEFGSAAGTTLGSTFTAMGIVTANAGTVTGIGRTANIGGGLVTSYAKWQVSTTLWGQDPSVYPDSLPRNVTAFNAWTLTKPFKTDSNLVINSTGVLTLNGNTLRVGGTVTQGGVLRMQNTADTMDVGKLFTVNSGTAGVGDLTGGMLRLHGGFAQNVGANSNFQPSGSHVTRFEGGSGQSATFGAAGATFSRFQDVEFADSVNFTGSIYVAGNVSLLTGGKVQSSGTATLASNLSDPTDLGWRYATTQLAGAPTLLPDSMVTNLTVAGTWGLVQRTRITGNLSVNSGGQLNLNGDTLIVSGSMTQGGVLLSAIPSALLDVGSAFVVNSGNSGTGSLTAGHLVLRQGFTQNVGNNSNFVAGAGFLTTFAGTGGHTLSFSAPGVGASTFSGLEVFDSLNVTGSFTTTGDVTIMPAGRMVGSGTGTLLGGLADSSGLGYRMTTTIIPGGQVIPAAMTTNLSLNGPWSLPGSFTLTGNLTLNSGADLTANGHHLSVSGGLVQGGILRMLLPADTVEVSGLFNVNSGTAGAGHLVDGRLLLHAGFTQTIGNTNNFSPSTSHVTEFVGSGGHLLSVSSFSAANSHFRHLIVRDSLSVTGSIAATGTVTLDPTGRLVGPGTGVLLGDLVDSSLAGWRMATTQLNGRFQAIPSALVSNVTLTDSIALAQNTSVTGTWLNTGNGYIAFSGHGLGVSGNFTQGSRLGMHSTQDSLDVGGLFLVNSGSNGTGDLTAGVIVLRGGMTQTVGNNTNFMSDAPHRVRFTGAAARTIDLSTPTLMHFGDLEMDASGLITLNSDVHANGRLTVAGGPVAMTAAAQRLLLAQDLSVDGLSLDRVRLEMHGTSNAAQVDNVTFTNIGPTLTQLSMELPGLAGDTLKLHNVTFSGTPTTGKYVVVADSVADGAVATVAFYNSAPLNGALFATVNGGAAGDTPSVLWSTLQWQTQPLAGTELLPFLPAPQVRAVDPSGSLLAGFTGTVTLGLSTDPSGGTAVLGGNSVAAVGGIATFDSLTLSLAGLGYRLQANAGGLGQGPPSSLFDITVPLPVGTTTAFNNGGGDNDWFNAANWTAGVPDSADNVFVFPGQSATVNVPATVNRVVIGTGGTIVLNATLTADSSIAAGNTIAGGGQLVARGTGTLSGVVGDLLVTGNYVVPTGGHLSATTITIDNIGVLDPGTDTITVTDSLRTLTAGILNMTSPSAIVDVGGDATFNGGQSTLNGGSLRLRKGLTSAHNFAVTFTPASTVVFQGTGVQSVSYAVADSNNALGNILFTGDTLRFATNAWVAGSANFNAGVTVIDSTLFSTQTVGGTAGAKLAGSVLWIRGGITFPGTFAVGTTVFAGNGAAIPALANPYDSVWVADTVHLGADVSATQLYVIGGGRFDLGGHRLDLTSDFGTTGGGTFAMTSDADTLFVGGTVYAFGGSTAGLLTHGLLQVAGNFYQGGIPNSIPVEVQGPPPTPPALDGFRADSGHTTRFVGTAAPRTIFFGSPVLPADPFSTNNSRFGRLELVDGVDSLGSTIPVAADLLVVSAAVINDSGSGGGPAVIGNVLVGPAVPQFQVSNLSLGGVLDFQPAPAVYQIGTTLFFGAAQSIPVLPYQGIEVDIGQATLAGDMTVQNVRMGVATEGPGFPGDLKLGGHKLTVLGNFTAVGQGTFTMTDPADSLDVSGGIDLGGGINTNITAGTLVARGDVSLGDSTFVASGTHHTVLAAPLSQQLWITTIDPTDEFNFLTVQAGTTVNFNVFSSGPLVVRDSFAVNGHFDQAAPGKTLIAYGDVYAGASASLVMGTVELHKSLDIDASIYNAQLTRYAGTGQVVSRTATYTDLEITGTAALDSTVTVTEDAAVRGNGVLDLAGQRLAVARDLTVADSGLLKMTAAADTVTVGRTALFDGGDATGSLTAGQIITNYLVQQATTSPRSFRATGTHRTEFRLQDPNAQTWSIQMATPGDTASQFQELIFDNQGGASNNPSFFGSAFVADSLVAVQTGGATLTWFSHGTVTVAGPFVLLDPVMNADLDTLELRGTLQVPFSSLGSVTTRFAGVAQQIPDTQNYNRIEVTGTASLETGGGSLGLSDIAIYGNGRLTLGANMFVNLFGGLTTAGNGTLAMTDPTADLQVGGLANFAGGDENGLLTGGTIHFKGDFTQAPGGSQVTFTTGNVGVSFEGSSGTQVVTIADGSQNNFRGVGITNPAGIQLNGLLLVTDSVGTAGPITGDSLYQFGNFFMNPGAQVALKVLKTAGLFSGTPSTYTVGRTHIVNPNTLPNVPFDTLVINASGVSAFFPLTANALYVAGAGSPFSTGGAASLDLGINSFPLTHTINGDLHIEGSNASLEIAEDTVNVSGDFYTSLGGTLLMNGPGALNVSGSTLFGGASEAGHLTSGALQVGSGITQQSFSSPSSFRMDGTALGFALGPSHLINLESPDSSWLPDINSAGAGTLNLVVVGRARIAGGLSAYGLGIFGDTLTIDGQVSGGPAGASASLTLLSAGSIQGGTFSSGYTVGTTHLTAPGFLLSLPYDTLVLSDSAFTSLSQGITANRLIITGSGNPLHTGPRPGRLFLAGGDGYADMSVSGDVFVSGAGAAVYNQQAQIDMTGDLTVDLGGLLVSNTGTFGGPSLFLVGGSAHLHGASTRDSLTSGQLRVLGDFDQGGPDPESFATDTGFHTVFAGGGTHRVMMTSPSALHAGGSQFGYINGIGANTLALYQKTTYVSNTLFSSAANPLTFTNQAGDSTELSAHNIFIDKANFDDVTLHWFDPALLPLGALVQADSITFTNFKPYEVQMVVEGVSTLPTPVIMHNIVFSPLNAVGTDPGRYVRTIDDDSPVSTTVSVQILTQNFNDPSVYFEAVNGSLLDILPFP